MIMEIWLDSCNFNLIIELESFGFIHGITTNPTLLSQASLSPYHTIDKILALTKGQVAVQVVATTHQEMLKQAQHLRTISDRIIVKIPVNKEGLLTMKALKKQQCPLMATAIFNPAQLILVSQIGVDYAAPYLAPMQQIYNDAIAVLAIMQEINKSAATKIITTAIETVDHIIACARIGVAAISVPSNTFQNWLSAHPNTTQALDNFDKSWQQIDDDLFNKTHKD